MARRLCERSDDQVCLQVTGCEAPDPSFRTRPAQSPQRVARAGHKSHSRLHFAHSTRTISAEGCARTGQIALSPAFRALDTHDLRRGLPATGTTRTRSPQRVARDRDNSHSRLHFAHSTRTIPAEGCPGPGQIALSPLSSAFRALDTHDLRRGLHFRLTLFVPPSAFKENSQSGEMFFIRTSPVKVFHTHTCILALGLHWDTYTCITLAYFCTWILTLAYLPLDAFTLTLTLGYSHVHTWILLRHCAYRSVSVQV